MGHRCVGASGARWGRWVWLVCWTMDGGLVSFTCFFMAQTKRTCLRVHKGHWAITGIHYLMQGVTTLIFLHIVLLIICITTLLLLRATSRTRNASGSLVVHDESRGQLNLQAAAKAGVNISPYVDRSRSGTSSHYNRRYSHLI
jgi:hypothetical protein